MSVTKKIIVSDDNEAYSSQNGMLFNKDKTELIFYFPDYEDVECIVPDSVNNIHKYAFYKTQNLKTLILSEGINTIGDNIFICNNSIEKLILPDSLTTIGKETFSYFFSLKYIEFGKNITEIHFADLMNYVPGLKEIVIKNPEYTTSELKYYKQNIHEYFNSDLTFCSYKKSPLERFCLDNFINFSVLNEENDKMIVYGDLDGDKNVQLSDLVLLSQYILEDIDFNQEQTEAADVQYDGCVDITDLARLKQYIMKDDIKLGK